jgi:hypothetical protein
MRTRRFIGLVLICLLLSSTLTACLPGDTELLTGLLDEWARQKGLNPKNEKGEIDPWGALVTVYNVGRRAATGSTGDKESDAALGVLEVVYPITTLDKQTDQGIDKGDSSKIEDAIKSRPNDYHYRDALGVLLLSKGDETGAKSAFSDSEKVWQKANPKLTMDRGDPAISRDTLSLLDRAIKAEATSGATDQGKALLRKRYCDEARYMSGTSSGAYYLNRAKNVLKFDCMNY